MTAEATATVWLMRHAKAREQGPGQADFDRALAREGSVEARAVGAWLALNLPLDVQVMASPALRVRMTLEAAAEGGAVLAPQWEPALYLAEITTLTQLLAAHEPPLLIVGHNPGLEELLQLLVKEPPAELAREPLMPTAAAFRIDYLCADRGAKAGSGRVVMHTRPTMLPPHGV